MSKTPSQSVLSRLTGGGVSLGVALAIAAAFAGDLSAQQQSASDQVTFARDVAPILQASCESCHREGSIAPMSLVTYDEVRPWAQLIRQKVTSRAMPPWPYDRSIGIQELKHDPSLSEEEIATVVAWADAGAPRGDPADMPPAIQWPDYAHSWQLEKEFGAPDIVVTSQKFMVPAEGLDSWPDSEVPITGIEGERWIRAVEIRPHTPESAYVFHHGNSSLRQRGEDGSNEGTALIAAAVGKMYDILPEDSGLKLLPGATVTTGFHLFPMGEEVEAAVDIAIYLYPEGVVPRFETEGSSTINADNTVTEDDGGWTKVSPVDAGGVRAVDIFIPPNSTQMLRGTWVVQKPTRIHSVRGHMHLRGKYQIVEAIYPDGRSEVLSKLNWEHRWHTDFLYEDDAMPLLPKGTMVVLTSFFDNTVNQPENPDPNQLVVFGRRSVDEMSHVWIGRTFFEQDEFDRLVAEREQILRDKEQRASVSQAAR